MNDSLMNTYRRLPVAFEKGSGAWLWDTDGKQYLDAISGIAVCNLGHAHPAITEAICQQAGQLVHTSNIYQIPAQQALADSLTQLAGMERVFFANSGAEANEAAIKLARLYGHSKGIDNPLILVTENSFHGRTLATLSATGNRKIQAGFEPLLPGFVRVPYNDLEAIRTAAENEPRIVAILVEPVQGEGGVNIPDEGYLCGIRQLCDQHDWLMMLDEIQTGMGRTGQWFAFQHEDCKPDVMTLAKALGNGMPIGACLARGNTAEIFQPGAHGSTYGGNPLACRTALAVVETLQSQALINRAQELGTYISDGFKKLLQHNDKIKNIRHKGLMIGIELDRPCGELVGQALEQGLLINVTADRVIRLLPPLVMTHEQADQLIKTLSSLISAFLSD